MIKSVNPPSFKKAVIVLCHLRTIHLTRVIDSMLAAEGIEEYEVVFVKQDSSEAVNMIIEAANFPKKHTIDVDGANYLSSAQAINGNLSVGMEFAFEDLSVDMLLVLEDDIVISKDALYFFEQVLRANIAHSKFRGVNGFSIATGPKLSDNSIVKLNYGLGWGWAIPKRTYISIRKYWQGDENNHWDFIFEPYIRTGYVVNPYRSRILNIGFDETATHTSSDSQLGMEIERSFSFATSHQHRPLVEYDDFFPWSGAVVNISALSIFKRKLLYVTNKVLFLIYLLDRGDKLFFHKLKRLVLTSQFISPQRDGAKFS